jgi:hypothetical protein
MVPREAIFGCKPGMLADEAPHAYPHARSDWTLDLTDPRVNVNDGWQYSRSLDDPEERWLAEVPPQLERLLTGSGLVSAGLAGPSGSSFTERSNGRQSPRAKLSGSNLSWARRRRWVGWMSHSLGIKASSLTS